MNLLGKIEIQGKMKELAVRKEGEIYKYFLDNAVIGAYDPDVMGDDLIVFRENTLENELSGQIRDEITQVIETAGKEEILKTDQEKEQEENVYDRQMGYQSTIGDKKTESTKKKSSKEAEEKKKDGEQKESVKGKKSKVENTTADIDVKQEIDMDTMVTDFDSLGEKLEKAGKIKGGDEKSGKLGIVESDELDNLRDENGERLEGHSSRYEAVVITNKTGKDGKPVVRALDLENDTQEGTNPTKRNYQIDQNKNKHAEKGDVLTRLQIQGEETIGIEKGQYGEVEVYHSHDKTIGGKGVEGNKSLDRQLETSDSKNPVEGMDEDMQKLAQEYQDGYRSVEASYQEANTHEDSRGEPCEEMEPEDLDGDFHTGNHNHVDEITTELMKNEEIADKFTQREVRDMVEKGWKNRNNDESLENFQKRMEEDIEQDAQNMRGERGR